MRAAHPTILLQLTDKLEWEDATYRDLAKSRLTHLKMWMEDRTAFVRQVGASLQRVFPNACRSERRLCRRFDDSGFYSTQ